jgi:hypothetical protein
MKITIFGHNLRKERTLPEDRLDKEGSSAAMHLTRRQKEASQPNQTNRPEPEFVNV